jgi:hypothetical protein
MSQALSAVGGPLYISGDTHATLVVPPEEPLSADEYGHKKIRE